MLFFRLTLFVLLSSFWALGIYGTAAENQTVKTSSQQKKQIATWQEAVAVAYDFNPQIRLARASVEIAKNQKRQAQSEWAPTLDAHASYEIQDSKKDNPTNAEPDYLRRPTQFGVTAKQNLFAGGGTTARIAQGRASVEAALFELEETEEQVFFELFQVILEIIVSNELRIFHKHNTEISRTLYRQTAARAEVGEISNTDVFMAKAKLAESESKYVEAVSRWEVAQASFEQLTGQKAAETFPWPELPFDIPQNDRMLLQKVLKQNHLVKSSARKERAASKNVHSQTASQMLPSLDLSADATRDMQDGTFKSPEVTYSRDPKSVNLGAKLALRIPIPTGSGQAIVRRSEQELNQARLNRQKTQLDIYQQTKKARSQLTAAIKNVERFTIELEGNQKALEAMQTEYEQGRRTFVDVSEIQSRKESSYQNLVEARKSSIVQKLKIKSLLGGLTMENLKITPHLYQAERPVPWLTLSRKEKKPKLLIDGA